MIYRKLLVSIMLGAFLCIANASSFADLKKWKSATLLNNRLRVDVPQSAQLVPPDYNIMAAPEPPEHELRVMIDAGNLRLVVFVEELFHVANGNFEALAKQDIRQLQEDYTFDPLAVAVKKHAGALELIEFTPKGKADLPGAHMIRGVLVRQADGTVQRMLFFVNDPGLKDLRAANRLVARFMASLKPGSRKLATGGRVHLARSGLTLELPDGYTTYTQDGVDFSVDHIVHIVPLGHAGADMGIYRGDNPEDSPAPSSARITPATLFGVKTKWKTWQVDGRIRQEALARLSGGSAGTLDVFIDAGSEKERAAFQRIAETAMLHQRAR